MTTTQTRHMAQTIAALVAVVFGFATIVAGSRVLMGSDPGYVAFRPLVIFNAVMGFVYVVAGVAIWRDKLRGRNAAAVVFFLNLVVLLGIVLLYVNGSAIAVESLRAMVLRTVVWLILFGTLFRLVRISDSSPNSLSNSLPR